MSDVSGSRGTDQWRLTDITSTDPVVMRRAAAGVVGAVATWFIREPRGRSLPGSPPAVAHEQEARELVGASRR